MYQDRWELIAKAAGLAVPLSTDGMQLPKPGPSLPAELRRLTLVPGAGPKPKPKEAAPIAGDGKPESTEAPYRGPWRTPV